MFEIKLNVSKIVVLTGSGPDKVMIHTDLPDGCWPYTGTQSLECQVASGAGPEYVKKHFNREPDDVIQVGAPKTKFSK